MMSPGIWHIEAACVVCTVYYCPNAYWSKKKFRKLTMNT